MYDYIIVGCGLSGMVIARELAEAGKKVLITEKRDHIGGNIYDYVDEHGILVQKYGPHVFFTDKKDIEEYITKFIPVDYFYAECRTYIDGKAIPMPFNFKSIDLIYDDVKSSELIQELIDEFGFDSIVSVVDLINSHNKFVHEYGMYMYEHEYRKYTAKQWGKSIEEIDASVFMRVPVYISYKKPYLKSKYQYMPRGGFTKFAKTLIDHKNINVKLCVDALDGINIDLDNRTISYKDYTCPIIYTGPLDALFNFKYGNLPYRALEFSWKVINKKEAPETPLSAYPEGDKYIRITDYTQFPPQDFGDKAVIAIEFPVEYKKNELCGNEPYYPTLTDKSKIIYKQYEALAKMFDNFHYIGRLAEFKYYNMDAIIDNALALSKKLLGE